MRGVIGRLVRGAVYGVVFGGCFLHLGAESKGAFEGRIFTDWSLTASPAQTAGGADTILFAHGFDNQRAYVGYGLTVSEKYTGKVVLDVGRTRGVTGVSAALDTTADNTAVVSGITTRTDDRFVAYLKTASIAIKDLLPHTSVVFGVKGRNQFSIQERFWGYRYIYKSFMDQEKYGSSADLGLGVKITPVDIVEMYVDVENGEGYTRLQGDTKYKSNLGVRLRPSARWDFYLYGDYMPFEDAARATQISASGFVGLRPVETVRVAVEYNLQKNTGGVADSDLHGISAYASVDVKVVDVFARFDLLSKSSATVDPYAER